MCWLTQILSPPFNLFHYSMRAGIEMGRGEGSEYLRETEMPMWIDGRVVTGDLGWPGSCDVLCGRRLPIGYSHV
jgi:hypothetical protein